MKPEFPNPKSGGSPIRLHVERLVLDGFPIEASAAARVQAAVEAELSRRLAAGGVAEVFRAGGAVPSVRGGDLQLAADLSPSNLGARIAQAIHAGIGRRATRKRPESDHPDFHTKQLNVKQSN